MQKEIRTTTTTTTSRDDRNVMGDNCWPRRLFALEFSSKYTRKKMINYSDLISAVRYDVVLQCRSVVVVRNSIGRRKRPNEKEDGYHTERVRESIRLNITRRTPTYKFIILFIIIIIIIYKKEFH